MLIRTVIWPDGTKHFLYNCPGCGGEHSISAKIHAFNENFEKPTFSPSVLYSGKKTCHSYIRDGMIEFLLDCWHDLKGKTVPLPRYYESIPELVDLRKEE